MNRATIVRNPARGR